VIAGFESSGAQIETPTLGRFAKTTGHQLKITVEPVRGRR
jgi:hypothetical protein